ncbi:hypothetical protein PGTUg99_030473 [Puccinia graminis f. sp. tritici]|uniref:Uncharacterized protein n=1 Tax=Puccinia graminis f. sp. tritici TaxID=56615 RepID=A0A5B0RTB2_PUCGR|nr:hypothetical protein PGTUg99_030473 [Puccinia graminis f. sp. tritici]
MVQPIMKLEDGRATDGGWPAQQSDLKVAGSRVSSDIHSARRPIHTHSAKPPIRSSQNTIRVPAINGTPSSGQPAATTPPDAPGSTLPT